MFAALVGRLIDRLCESAVTSSCGPVSDQGRGREWDTTGVAMNDTEDNDTCPWANSSPAMRAYHDEEWGRPSHDDGHLFEMLILEGAQAGLSWSIVLNKRETYRAAFAGFDAVRIADFTDAHLEQLRLDPGIIRNRLKIEGTRKNAIALLRLQEEFGSFDTYLWGRVDSERIVHHPRHLGELPTTTDLSDAISKDLKKRGFTFVGSTIIYSLLEAVGIVDDHVIGCPAKLA
jgi:DNA-3-methyladenine glycosylase I